MMSALRLLPPPGRAHPAAPGPRPHNGRLPLALCLACAPLAAPEASTPSQIDTSPEPLPAFTTEFARADPFAAEARCRAFVTALYHRLRTESANPARAHSAAEAFSGSGPLAWVTEAYVTLPPASAPVRAAAQSYGDQTRAYLDAFGPAALADTLPSDPLYQNDRQICAGLLGLTGV